jgi:uncharacterized protein (DUF2141 family)
MTRDRSCSPDEAQRNPGVLPRGEAAPHFASLHAGYVLNSTPQKCAHEGYPMRACTLLLPIALVLAVGSTTGASAQSPGRLSVSVDGVRNDSGAVRCGLYSSPNGFREPGREMRGAVAPIKNGQATCVFNGLPAGSYAVAVFHAEHNETQMETGLFGKPKQGYGFSNNPSTTFGPPSFSGAAFDYKGGNLALPVRLSY